MDDNSAANEKPGTKIDEQTRQVLTDQVMAILDDDWLNICDIDRVARTLDQLRQDCGMPKRDKSILRCYPEVAVLHCVPFLVMNRSMLDGLPAALLNVLGLDHKTGPLFLGKKHWGEVERRYQREHVGKPMRAPSQPPCAEGTAPPVEPTAPPLAAPLTASLSDSDCAVDVLPLIARWRRISSTGARSPLATTRKHLGNLLRIVCQATHFTPKSSSSQPAWKRLCDSYPIGATAPRAPAQSHTHPPNTNCPLDNALFPTDEASTRAQDGAQRGRRRPTPPGSEGDDEALV